MEEPLLEPIREKSNRYEHLQRVYSEAMEKARSLEWYLSLSVIHHQSLINYPIFFHINLTENLEGARHPQLPILISFHFLILVVGLLGFRGLLQGIEKFFSLI